MNYLMRYHSLYRLQEIRLPKLRRIPINPDIHIALKFA